MKPCDAPSPPPENRRNSQKPSPRTSLSSASRVLAFCCLAWLGSSGFAGDLGLFDSHEDIGSVVRTGSASLDAAESSYEIGGGGDNMWFTNDAFHFVWKKVSGDFAVQAAISWLQPGGNAHRKACLLVRQSLQPDAAYVDVAVHGDGLTSLQYREHPGAMTHEIQANVNHPERVGLERRADTFFMTLPQAGGGSAPLSGSFIRLKFSDPVYVGLGVCAHDNSVLERARFSNVSMSAKASTAAQKAVLHCALELVPIGSKDRRVVYYTTNHIEAPNWSRDGRFLLFNSGGGIFRLPVTGGVPERIETGFAVHCNNDHGLSPDGSQLAINDQSRGPDSRIYILPASGGTPRLLTDLAPSYWHGWSPDGSTIAYCAKRDGEFDIYTMPAAGGPEKRLTTAKGLDDGPDYSPDGRYIYFNSERSGTMQIWRMKPDGGGQEPVTKDPFNNWFPHPSPDGKWLAFLSYEHDVTGHPANQLVRLRLLPFGGGEVQELAQLFGGQGTLNVPSWSPDSKQIAFVSYELIAP